VITGKQYTKGHALGSGLGFSGCTALPISKWVSATDTDEAVIREEMAADSRFSVIYIIEVITISKH
jgi:hypothetical protein